MPLRPLRIQRKRTKGWKTPPNTVYCGRPGPWGNVWGSVLSFEKLQLPTMDLEPLRGKNLSCWCNLCDRHKDGKPLDEHCDDCSPCHVDVLGKISNGYVRAANLT